MEGLTVLQHDVVGDVYDVVDGPHAGEHQAPLHPPGGLLDLYVLDDPAAEPGAEVRSSDLDLDVALAPFGGFLGASGLGISELGAEGGSGFPGYAQHRQAVGPVGSDLEIDGGLFYAQGLDDGSSRDEAFVVQDPEPVLIPYGDDLVGEAQLLAAAHHAAALDSAKLSRPYGLAVCGLGLAVKGSGDVGAVQCDRDLVPFLHVGCAGDDLDRLVLSDVHLADHQLRRVGMGLDLLDPADHDSGDLLMPVFDGFQVGPGEDHTVDPLLVADVDVRIFS